MRRLRLVSTASLRWRLTEALGHDPALHHDLDGALAGDDPKLLDAAIEAVRAAPEATRDAVHEAIADWLLVDDPEALPDITGPSRAIHRRRAVLTAGYKDI